MMPSPNEAFRRHPIFGPAIAAEAKRIMASEGLTAFQSSKRAAAYHECGHALADALLETPATAAKIWRASIHGLPSWGGLCAGAPAWVAHEGTDPRADFRSVLSLSAGVAAEEMFCQGDFHPPASLEEVVVVRSLCSMIGAKLGVSPSVVALAARDFHRTNFEAHADAMHKAAGILMACGRLTEKQLDHIFAMALPGAWARAFYYVDPDAAERELDQARREVTRQKRAAKEATKRANLTIAAAANRKVKEIVRCRA